MNCYALKRYDTKLHTQFQKKQEILSSLYKEISPLEFVTTLFERSLDDYVILSSKTGVHLVEVNDLYKFCFRDDAYLVYCDFRNNYYSLETFKRLWAFVVDIDNLTDTGLKILLQYMPTPSFIVNSGGGIHVIYAVSGGINNRAIADALNKTITKYYRNLVKKTGTDALVDGHSIVHPFRMPGSLTKSGERVSVYKLTGKYTLEGLFTTFGMVLITTTTSNPKHLGPYFSTHKGFYEFVKAQYIHIQPGCRNKFFFLLGVTALKCNVPLQKAISDASTIYTRIDTANFTIEEMEKAVRSGYRERYITMSWKSMVEFVPELNICRKQAIEPEKKGVAFLKKITSQKRTNKNAPLRAAVRRLRSRGLSLRAISRQLGVSKDTVRRLISN